MLHRRHLQGGGVLTTANYTTTTRSNFPRQRWRLACTSIRSFDFKTIEQPAQLEKVLHLHATGLANLHPLPSIFIRLAPRRRFGFHPT